MKRPAIAFCLMSGMLGWVPAFGANPVFQDYFFDVCANPSGALAARCGETPEGSGDLSSDSESSLNPSQTLGATDGALAQARARSKQSRERVDRYRRDAEATGPRVSLGPVSLLVNGRLESEDRDRSVDADAERGYEADRHAVELGFDRRFSDRFVAGLLYGYEDGRLRFDGEAPAQAFAPPSDAGEVEREAHSITLFGLIHLSDQAYLEANAGYADSDYTLERRAVFQESTRTTPQTDVRVRADTGGSQRWLGITAGYQWQPGAVSYGVYGGATYSRSRVDGYREEDLSGSGLALVVDDVSRDAFTSHLGFRVQRSIGTRHAVWLPQMRVEYEHSGATDDARSSVRFELDTAANVLELTGDDSDDWFNAAVGLAAIFPNGWISFADLEAIVGAEDRQRYRITVGLRKEL